MVQFVEGAGRTERGRGWFSRFRSWNWTQSSHMTSIYHTSELPQPAHITAYVCVCVCLHTSFSRFWLRNKGGPPALLSQAFPETCQMSHSSRASAEGLEASNPEALPWTDFIYSRLQLPLPVWAVHAQLVDMDEGLLFTCNAHASLN